MKRRIFVLGLIIVFMLGVFLFFCPRKTEMYDGYTFTPHEGEFLSKCVYEINGKYNTHGGGEMDVYDGYKNNIHLDVKLTQGRLVVKFYDWRNGEKDPETNLIRTEYISESGIYDYSMDYLPEGKYWVIIDEVKTDDVDEMTVGEVSFVFSNKK